MAPVMKTKRGGSDCSNRKKRVEEEKVFFSPRLFSYCYCKYMCEKKICSVQCSTVVPLYVLYWIDGWMKCLGGGERKEIRNRRSISRRLMDMGR